MRTPFLMDYASSLHNPNTIMIKYVAATVWTLMILLGSSMPGNEVPSFDLLDFAGIDKIFHFIAYAMMVLLWSIALKSTGKRIGGARVAFYGSILFGITMEIAQNAFFESRTFDIMDIIANIMGSIVGLTLFYKLF